MIVACVEFKQMLNCCRLLQRSPFIWRLPFELFKMLYVLSHLAATDIEWHAPFFTVIIGEGIINALGSSLNNATSLLFLLHYLYTVHKFYCLNQSQKIYVGETATIQ